MWIAFKGTDRQDTPFKLWLNPPRRFLSCQTLTCCRAVDVMPLTLSNKGSFGRSCSSHWYPDKSSASAESSSMGWSRSSPSFRPPSLSTNDKPYTQIYNVKEMFLFNSNTALPERMSSATNVAPLWRALSMPPEKSWDDAESSPALRTSSVRQPWDPTKDPGGVQVAAFAFVVSDRKKDDNSRLAKSQSSINNCRNTFSMRHVHWKPKTNVDLSRDKRVHY